MQKIVVFSCTKVEYVAMTKASKEMMQLEVFLTKLGKGQRNYRLYNNNINVIHLVGHATLHVKIKHIELMCHFICTLLEGRHISLEKIHCFKPYRHVNQSYNTRENEVVFGFS